VDHDLLPSCLFCWFGRTSLIHGVLQKKKCDKTAARRQRWQSVPGTHVWSELPGIILIHAKTK
jgi:hypothetical protein